MAMSQGLITKQRRIFKTRATIIVFVNVSMVWSPFVFLYFHLKVVGDNYNYPVDQGDQFNGTISNSAVGGRTNKNILYNTGTESGKHRGRMVPCQAYLRHFEINTDQAASSKEAELIRKLKVARDRLAAKKERERLKQKELELERIEAELQD